jgi:hypothetical protein
MDKIEELGAWLLANQSKKDSPEFQDKISEYRLLRFQQKYQEASQLPDGDRKAMILDRLRTEISNAGGTPELTQGPLVTQEPSEEQPDEVPVVPQAPVADKSGADPASRMLYGGIGAGVGAVGSGTGMALGALENRAGRVAGIQERARVQARIEAMREAREAAARAPSAGIVTDPRAPVPPTPTQTGRGIQGTIKEPNTPMAQTGRASMTAFNQNTKDIAAGAREQQSIIEALRNNPRTPPLGPLPGAGFTGASPTGIALRPELPTPTVAPEPQLGNLRQLPPQNINAQDARTIANLPSLARTSAPARSGLDMVTDIYRGIMSSPLTEAAGRVARRISPPAALASAGLDLAEIENELRKEADQRDYVKTALRAAGLLGGGIAALPIPGALPVGAGIGLGAAGLEYLKDKGYLSSQ